MTRPNTLRRGLVLLGLVWSTALSSSVLAQQAEPEAEPAPIEAGATRDVLRKRVVQKVRRARIELLTDKLQLDEKSAQSLDVLLKESDKVRRQARREVKRARAALQEALSRDDATDQELAQLTEAWVAARRLDQEALDQLFDDAKGLLSPRQLAQLHLILPEFERKVRRLITEARKERRQKRGLKRRKGSKGDRPRNR